MSAVQKTVVRGDFEVRLTGAEFTEHAQRSAELHKEINDLQGDITAFLREKKAEMQRRREDLNRLLEAMRTGVQRRSMLAIEEKDFELGTVTFFDKETGTVLLKRTMDVGERQMGLELQSEDEDEQLSMVMGEGEVSSEPPPPSEEEKADQ